MNICVSGTDHSTSSVAARERCSLDADGKSALLRHALTVPGIRAAAALSTCNRTEIYLSLDDGVHIDPFSLLPGAPDCAYSYSGREAFEHLALLASGLKSRLFAEDQILTQVKDALVFSREHGAADGSLEVFFREAVTAAKKIKTQLHFSHGDVAAATAARNLIMSRGGIKNVLVIGNGEIGRAAASALAEAGFYVTMTLRQYRHGEIELPRGVTAVDYADRLSILSRCDAVISATASPHYTITLPEAAALPHLPALFLDLAMPRDIDPELSSLPGVRLLDIDDVADSASREVRRGEALAQAAPIVDGAWDDLISWFQGKERSESDFRHSHFPLFIDSSGKSVLVVGGGRIASRRVETLAKFEFDITVVAPEFSDEILRLAERGRLTLVQREFEDGDLDGAFLAVAATDSRSVNHRIYVLARHAGTYASICDRRGECSVYFPAVAEKDNVIVGICGNGVSHHEVAVTAKKIREALKDGTH